MSQEELLAAIAQLEQRLSAKIDGGYQRMEEKMDRIEEKMETMEIKMEMMEADMGEMEGRIMEKLDNVMETRQDETREENDEDRASNGNEEEETSNLECESVVDGWSVKKYSTGDKEGDLKTAREGGKPLPNGRLIEWNEGDEIIKRMQAERMTTDEEIPSMWNYDPRCLPKEFVDMKRETFIVEPTQANLCFVEKEILIKICKNLMPLEYLRLSSACRYLHWRIFAFTTCYAPYDVEGIIRDLKIDYYYKRGSEAYQLYENTEAKIVYSLSLEENDRRRYPMLSAEEGDRAAVARIPSCLRRPFRFKNLIIDIHSPFFTKEALDRCLSLIQHYRPLVDEMSIIFIYYNLTGLADSSKYYHYPAINNFLKTLQATFYRTCTRRNENIDRMLEIFARCPYARTIDHIEMPFDENPQWEDIVLLNIGGDYCEPPMSAIIRTIDYWRNNDFGTLKYHGYSLYQYDEKTTLFLEYFFANFEKYEEYYHEYDERIDERTVEKGNTTMKCVTMETSHGEKYGMKVIIHSGHGSRSTNIFFGKEEELEERYGHNWEMSSSDKWWKIETAVEPEVDEEDEKTTAREKEDEETTTPSR